MPTVKLFGVLKENYPFLEGQHAAANTQELIQYIDKNYPGFSQQVYLISVNHELCLNNIELSADDLVVFMPPFSGG